MQRVHYWRDQLMLRLFECQINQTEVNQTNTSYLSNRRPFELNTKHCHKPASLTAEYSLNLFDWQKVLVSLGPSSSHVCHVQNQQRRWKNLHSPCASQHHSPCVDHAQPPVVIVAGGESWWTMWLSCCTDSWGPVGPRGFGRQDVTDSSLFYFEHTMRFIYFFFLEHRIDSLLQQPRRSILQQINDLRWGWQGSWWSLRELREVKWCLDFPWRCDLG